MGKDRVGVLLENQAIEIGQGISGERYEWRGDWGMEWATWDGYETSEIRARATQSGKHLR
jgi:hypothetical protein